MDDETADALSARLSVLEHRMLPSYSTSRQNDTIATQVADRLRRLQEFEQENQEVRQFFQLARKLGLYRHLPVGATDVSQEDAGVKRQVVVAQLGSFQTLLARFDEMQDLLPVLDRLNGAIGRGPAAADGLRSRIADVSNKYYALTLQSTALAEHLAQCVQRENENWADIEQRLRRIEERLDAKPRD